MNIVGIACTLKYVGGLRTLRQCSRRPRNTDLPAAWLPACMPKKYDRVKNSLLPLVVDAG